MYSLIHKTWVKNLLGTALCCALRNWDLRREDPHSCLAEEAAVEEAVKQLWVEGQGAGMEQDRVRRGHCIDVLGLEG